jgi:hypothetical protein
LQNSFIIGSLSCFINYSQFFSSEKGVRSNENLRPILYLNDLQTYLDENGAAVIELYEHWLKLLIRLFADDTLIVSDNPVDLQHGLNYVTRIVFNVN